MRGVAWLRNLNDAGPWAGALRDPFGAVGLGLGIVGTILDAGARSDAADANAAISRQNAALALEEAAWEARQIRKRTRSLISAQAAAGGASGLAVDGSLQLVMEDTAYEGELEALHVLKRGDLAAGRYNAQAGAFEDAADAALVGGLLGAGAGLFVGASDLLN